jgi:restriction system protein
MSRRSGNGDLALAAVAVFVVLTVGSLVATALQSWSGRFLLLVALGGGSWLTVKAARWTRNRRRIHAETLGQLLALSPARFEQAVAQLLGDEGYRRVQIHGGAGDLQADVTAVAPDGASVVVQCKRYAPGNKVGSPAVQSFIGMATVHHRAARGMLVTTSSFTQPATDLARRHRIELIDGQALVRRLQRHASRPSTTGFAATSSPTFPTQAPTPAPSASPPNAESHSPAKTSPTAAGPPATPSTPPPPPRFESPVPAPPPSPPWTSRGST